VDKTSGNEDLTVAFTNTSTGTDSFEWDFDGNGTTDSTAANPTFTYTTPGTYEASLTVTNYSGSDTTSQTITVAAIAPPPMLQTSLVPNYGDAGWTNFTITTDGNADWDNIVMSVNWGDGSPVETSVVPYFQHRYVEGGILTPCLTWTNDGGSTTRCDNAYVSDPTTAPTANFFVDQDGGEAPLTVNFEYSWDNMAGRLEWDFDGDGTTDSTSEMPGYFTYTTPGVYTATLTSTNRVGSTTASQTITVEPLQP
jgi:PKD repeat protein